MGERARQRSSPLTTAARTAAVSFGVRSSSVVVGGVRARAGVQV